MLIRDYYLDKNKVTMTFLKQLLVPADQIKNIPVTVKMVENMQKYINELKNTSQAKLDAGNHDILLSDWACPYCAAYFLKKVSCDGCPMSSANNLCASMDSTYHECSKAVNKLNGEEKWKMRGALLALAIRFVEYHSYLLGGDE